MTRLLIIWTLLTPFAFPAEYPRVAPFRGLRWNGESPEILVQDTWLQPLAVNDVAVDDILDHSRERHGSRWQKRFGEDLVQLLCEMGHPPGDRVTLRVRDLEDGRERELRDVEMTRENREAVRRGGSPPARAARSSREHGPGGAAEWSYLTTRIDNDGPRLPRAAAEQDLDQLEWSLENEFSYLRLREVDHRAALDEVRAALGDEIDLASFALALQKVIARFGDGHSGVSGAPDACSPPGFLPFLVMNRDDRFVAVNEDRRGFVDPARPYLVEIDGRPVADWIAAAAQMVPDGSPAFRRRAATRALRLIALLRSELGAEPRDHVTVTLVDERGKRRKNHDLPLADHKPIYGDWPRTESRRIAGDIGYLRVADMDDEPSFLAGLTGWMEAFADTRGLIIDVRGNGGGTRDALALLLPYFLPPDAPPVVVNVARKRLRPGEPASVRGGLLADRRLFPASMYSGAAATAVERVTKHFEPTWTPQDDHFSEWHYMVLEAATAGGDAYHYDRPVIVLQDDGCFSATDIFIGAFAELDGVTRLGVCSGGGSGRGRRTVLAHSGLQVRLSSMASFRPDGRSYDTLGVEPDVVIEPVPTDFIGETDSQLDAAIARLKSRRGG